MQIAHYGRQGYHPGVDMNGPGGGDSDLGNPIYSACDGVVEYEGVHKSWGKILIIRETYEEETEEREVGVKEEAQVKELYGIDISHWQTGKGAFGVDWNRVPMFDFYIIKATQGIAHVDTELENFRKEIRNRGGKLGYYHYADPRTFNPMDEADHFIRTVGQLQDGEFMVLDFEEEEIRDFTNWCKTFMDRVREVTGVTPVFYTYDRLLRAYDFSLLKDYPLWVARYGRNNGKINRDMMPRTGSYDDWMIWQYTSAAMVDGFRTKIDLNVAKCLPQGYVQPVPTPVPAPQPAPIDVTPPQPVPAPMLPNTTHQYQAPKKSLLQIIVEAILRLLKK